jgi:hypothetical protein
MYNVKSSFNKYLRDTVLSELGSGVNLYTDINSIAAYPAVIVSYLEDGITDISKVNSLNVRFTVLSNDNKQREADQLTDSLLNQLKVKSGNGNYITLYDFEDPEDPESTGKYIKWFNMSNFKVFSDNKNPELRGNSFELGLFYSE